MNSAYFNPEHRCEPRFHPATAQVCWRKMGAEEFETGELLDVSQTGISFRMESDGRARVAAGDEIDIRYEGQDGSTSHYAVVWEHTSEPTSLTVGCTRLSSSGEAAQKRTRYSLVMARVQRRVTVRHRLAHEESDAVITGTIPTHLA
jgi:PilZ domain